jgi:hypothetical protein
MNLSSSHSARPAPVMTAAVSAPSGLAAQRYGDCQHWREVGTRALVAGDAELAMRCWKHVRQLQPESPDALFHIACCHALLNEASRACLIFEGLANMPSVPAPMRERAARLALLTDPERAPSSQA